MNLSSLKAEVLKEFDERYGNKEGSVGLFTKAQEKELKSHLSDSIERAVRSALEVVVPEEKVEALADNLQDLVLMEEWNAARTQIQLNIKKFLV